MKDVFGYMIGPKAENMDLFKKLIIDAIDDHMFWRRNFHPEDTHVITASIQNCPEFQTYTDKIKDNLFQYLSDAKTGVPFFSNRYIGHMNTDLLLPALVGTVGAVLYNNNNVAGESSPVTIQYEHHVVQMLLKMIGISKNGWGYLTSGGTSANIYSLWLARNLRTLPFSLKLLINSPPASLQSMEDEFINHGMLFKENFSGLIKKIQQELAAELESETAKGTLMPIDEMSLFEMMNIPVSELCSLRGRGVKRIRSLLHSMSDKESEIIFDTLTRCFQLQTLGIKRFRSAISDIYPQALPVIDADWKIYVSASSHYSWPKSADLLGFGYESVEKISLLPGFDINVDALASAISNDTDSDTSPTVWPFFFSSIFGTTEEGALDNLTEINSVLDMLKKEKGITIWNHTDACYGGYLASMLRENLDDDTICPVGDIKSKGTLKHWLHQLGMSMGLNPDESERLVNISETGSGNWLSWQELVDRTAAMAASDSISIDPHKLGYIPYPAGAILINDHRAREVMSTDAPYLWADSNDSIESFTGRYTLEGSRPGTAAAACWLAHKTITLDQAGHGRLIALSILSSRKLYQTLVQQLNNPESSGRVAMMHQPHTNILCYAPYHTEYLISEDADEIIDDICNALHPTNQFPEFMAVSTKLEIIPQATFEEGLHRTSLFFKMIESSQKKFQKVIRSVVMGPYGLQTNIKPKIGEGFKTIYEKYAEYLAELIQTSAENMLTKRAKETAEKWTRHANTLVMDDDDSTVTQLQNAIQLLRHPKIADHLQYCETEESAVALIQDYNVPLDFAFLDIDMRGSSQQPKGRADAGFYAFEAILIRNSQIPIPEFKVKAVFFFTRGYLDFDNRLKSIESRYKDFIPFVIKLDRNALATSASEKDRVKTAEAILRQLSDITL